MPYINPNIPDEVNPNPGGGAATPDDNLSNPPPAFNPSGTPLYAPSQRDLSQYSLFKKFFMPGVNQQIMAEQFAPSHLRASLERARMDQDRFKGLRNRAAASISTQRAREGGQLRRTAAQMVQLEDAKQGPPTSFAGAVEQATRRAKARTGIIARGEKAIANQNLRDRLAFAKAGMQKEGSLQVALQKAANIREGVNVGVSDANAEIAASNAALAGGVIGGIGGFLSNENNRDWLGGIFKKQPEVKVPKPGSGDGAPPT